MSAGLAKTGALLSYISVIVPISLFVNSSTTGSGVEISKRQGCEPQWISMEGIPGFDGGLGDALNWDPDGPGPQREVLVVGGAFSIAGNTLANDIAAWDGQAWHSLGEGIGGSVNSLAEFRGELIAAGTFTTAGGVKANGIARWDGLRWQPLGEGLGRSQGRPEARALMVYHDELLVAGIFDTAGGVRALSLARWDGTEWRPWNATNEVGWINALTSLRGELIVGGTFAISSQGFRVARWDGLQWQPLGAGVNNDVTSLGVYKGELIAGGWFTAAGGAPANHIARWDGTNWHALGAGLTHDSSPIPVHIRDLFEHNGRLIATGDFTKAGGLSAHSVAQWDGQTWTPLREGLGCGPHPFRVIGGPLIEFQGELIGGGCLAFDFDQMSSMLRWDGNAWRPLEKGLNSHVHELVVFNGDLVAGGRFTRVGDIGAERVAGWDGKHWYNLGGDFQTRLGYEPSMEALQVFKSDLYAGGTHYFTSGATRASIGRWDGENWQPLSGASSFSCVDVLTAHSHELVVGGFWLASINGQLSRSVASWNGSTWDALGGGVTERGRHGIVRAATVYQDELIIGGDFDRAGGGLARNIARWDGARWHPLASGVDATVDAFCTYRGQLIAGGHFSVAGGGATNRIARWDGKTWYPLGEGVVTDGQASWVHALTQYDGELIAGGSFDFAGVTRVNNIARWDGIQWRPLGDGSLGVEGGGVAALGVHDGDLFVGGNFTSAGGEISGFLAQWGFPAGLRIGDMNCDELVNTDDFPSFADCRTAPDVDYAPGCIRADGDADGDVDLVDFAGFQRAGVAPP